MLCGFVVPCYSRHGGQCSQRRPCVCRSSGQQRLGERQQQQLSSSRCRQGQGRKGCACGASVILSMGSGQGQGRARGAQWTGRTRAGRPGRAGQRAGQAGPRREDAGAHAAAEQAGDPADGAACRMDGWHGHRRRRWHGASVLCCTSWLVRLVMPIVHSNADVSSIALPAVHATSARCLRGWQ